MALSSRTAILARHASGFWTWDVGSTDGLRPGLGFSGGGGAALQRCHSCLGTGVGNERNRIMLYVCVVFSY